MHDNNYTIVRYTSDGVTTDYAIPFPYLTNMSGIVVQYADDYAPIPYTILNRNTLRLLEVPQKQVDFVIYRDTDITLPVVDWKPGVSITADNLNTMVTQLIHAMQEMEDSLNYYGLTKPTKQQMPVGGGSDKVFYLNDTVVTYNYTIPRGTNAGSFGPVLVNSGVDVVVPANSTWTVV